ncbi:MAG: hypothetical protein KDM91_22310 [Verrucomicrobiae bacterium]|nr:hypothetical protein [Verrucomicrobiae bacterium]
MLAKSPSPSLRGMLSLLSAGILATAAAAAGDDSIQRVEAFLQPRLLAVPGAEAKPAVVEAVLARPDPGTFFLRYAFGMKRHAKTLLTPGQTVTLEAVIATHSPIGSRWHDERNTLRCRWNAVMWRHAAASEADAPAVRRELEEWMRLRMLWTRQEHLAQYRFAREVWDLLTPEQQAKLIAGDWKAHATLDTGHQRADATAKIVTRALGKPDRTAEFEAAGAAWSNERVPLHTALRDAEDLERRLAFAMDLNDEGVCHRAAVTATDAYAKLYLAEANAVRRLVRAGYADAAAGCDRAAAEAWAEAPKRFAPGAADLIRLLSPP